MLLAVLSAAPALAQRALPPGGPNDSGRPMTPEQAAIDVGYVALDLRIDPTAQTLGGTMELHARVVAPTDAVVLDLDRALGVTAAKMLGGRALPVERPLGGDPDRLRLDLGRTAQPGETLRLRVAYGGTPRVAPMPPWDGGLTWSQTADGRPWVAVSCQMNGADLWWPAKDHPSDEPDSVRVALTVPAGLRAVANGRAEGRSENADGTVTERWVVRYPINAYGVSFGVAPYALAEADYTSPLGHAFAARFWVLPERLADAERQLPGFLDALGFLERTFGPYPWRADGYTVLHTPYLGMEHQNLIAYGSDFQDNAEGFDWLHFHELAHEWWANLATAPDWRDFWVHESFASFAEALYAEDLAARRGEDGDAAFLRYLARSRPRLLNEIAVAPREPRTTQQMYLRPSGGSNGDIYSKGAHVLKTLRYLIDDDAAFLEAMRRMLYPDPADEARTDGRVARWVSTADVQARFEAAAGRSLAGEFEVYLRQPALPRLAVERGPAEATLRWVLPVEVPRAFEVPVEVEVGGRRVRVEMPGGVGRVAVRPREPLVLDPGGRILFEPD